MSYFSRLLESFKAVGRALDGAEIHTKRSWGREITEKFCRAVSSHFTWASSLWRVSATCKAHDNHVDVVISLQFLPLATRKRNRHDYRPQAHL